MSAVLNAALPIFALILAGFACARRGNLGPHATDSLNSFVVWLALPALLFQAMAQITRAEIDHPAFLAAYGGGMMGTFACSFALDRRRGLRLADRAIEGLDAAYANTGFMGIPLCLAALGPASLPPAIIATLLTACVLFAAAIVLIEADLQRPDGGARPGLLPVLAGSGAYALSEAFGWREGLDQRLLKAKAFYAAIAVSTAVGVGLNFTSLNPVKALYWSAVVNGVLAAPVMAVIMLVAGNQRIMGRLSVPRPLLAAGWLATLVMLAASIGFFVL